jgi:hypothetical protein
VGHADVVSMLRGDYHTAMTPIVVLSWPDDPVKASWFEQRVPFIQAVDHNLETAALMEQVTALKKEAGSLVLDEEAARAMSLEAAEVLKRIALASRVYSAKRARQSLLDGLTNRPDALVISVLGALAEIADAEITRAMADVAVNAERAKPVRVAALQNLARAARFVGNELSDEQVSALQEMAGETDDDLRDAAGEALGALDLDAAEGAEIILQHGAH